MIRILGAITGSALALATLLVVIGIPQFKTEGSASERAIVTLPLPTTPVDRTDAATSRQSASTDGGTRTAGDTSDDVDAGEEAAPLPDPPIDDAVTETPPPTAIAGLPEPTEPAASDPERVLDSPQSWYAFWSPFRSELAANGFVAQLQSVTGLDYRVVRIKPGVYEVAFAYENDADITANLTQITAATGLELPQ